MSTEDLHEIFDRKGSGPLSGIVVADFSRVLAGPYATMMLADPGATVIKVEGPGGDDTRLWKPPVRDETTYYLSINRNKYDVVLDFKDSDDLELARELARRADVVVENFKPGGLVKFGLDYDSVVKDNPNVVYSSVTGFGPSNPQPGYDLLIQGLSGFMSLTGDADGPPFRAGVAIFDVITGLHTTIGILAAFLCSTDSIRGGAEGRHEPPLIRPVGAGQSDVRGTSSAVSRTAWAISTPACTRISRCPRRTVTSSSPAATTVSSSCWRTAWAGRNGSKTTGSPPRSPSTAPGRTS